MVILIQCVTDLQKHTKVDDTNLKKKREDLQSRVDLLRKQADVRLSGDNYFHLTFCVQDFIQCLTHFVCLRTTMIKDLL